MNERLIWAICLVIGALTGAFVLTPTEEYHEPEIPIFPPALSNRDLVIQEEEDPLLRMAIRNQLTPTARLKTYDRIETHPLIIEAADILTDRLRPYAKGVYVTSFTRSPEDQKRLLKEKRSKYWATQRSKHLSGLAADVGFVKRRVSTHRMRDIAEKILKEELPPAQFELLRIVRESYCIHVEIDTRKGRDIIVQRKEEMENLGIVKLSTAEAKYPVPKLGDYVNERAWTETRNFLTPLPF